MGEDDVVVVRRLFLIRDFLLIELKLVKCIYFFNKYFGLNRKMYFYVYCVEER